MKTLLTSLLLAVALCVLCAAPAAAQTAMRVQIPFAFTAGSQFLPAGEYSVNVDAEHMLSIITAADSTERCLVRLVPGSTRNEYGLDKGLLRFEKYGRRYVLTGIWKAGWSQGNGVPHPRPPKELAGERVVQDVAESR